MTEGTIRGKRVVYITHSANAGGDGMVVIFTNGTSQLSLPKHLISIPLSVSIDKDQQMEQNGKFFNVKFNQEQHVFVYLLLNLQLHAPYSPCFSTQSLMFHSTMDVMVNFTLYQENC